MTNTPETPARFIPETRARIITQKLEYWGEGVADFACEASLIVRALKEKLENPTRENLEEIRDDTKALYEAQKMIKDINAAYIEGLEKFYKRLPLVLKDRNSEEKEEAENAEK